MHPVRSSSGRRGYINNKTFFLNSPSGGYLTLPSTPSGAPGTNSRAVNDGPENGASSARPRVARIDEQPGPPEESDGRWMITGRGDRSEFPGAPRVSNASRQERGFARE